MCQPDIVFTISGWHFFIHATLVPFNFTYLFESNSITFYINIKQNYLSIVDIEFIRAGGCFVS